MVIPALAAADSVTLLILAMLAMATTLVDLMTAIAISQSLNCSSVLFMANTHAGVAKRVTSSATVLTPLPVMTSAGSKLNYNILPRTS